MKSTCPFCSLVTALIIGSLSSLKSSASEAQAGNGIAPNTPTSTNGLNAAPIRRRPSSPGSAVLEQNGLTRADYGAYKREKISLGDLERLLGFDESDMQPTLSQSYGAKTNAYSVFFLQGRCTVHVPVGTSLTNKAALVDAFIITNGIFLTPEAPPGSPPKGYTNAVPIRLSDASAPGRRQPANPGSAVLLQNGFTQSVGGTFERQQISLGEAEILFGLKRSDFQSSGGSPAFDPRRRTERTFWVQLAEGHCRVTIPPDSSLTNPAALIDISVRTNPIPRPPSSIRMPRGSTSAGQIDTFGPSGQVLRVDPGGG